VAAPVTQPLLSVRGLTTWLDTGEAIVRAVDGVSFDIERQETFALLGESGCGKSMTALSLMRLLPDAGQVISGSASLDGVDLMRLPETEMRNVRGSRIAMIFQEPMLSLNPVMTVGDQIAETLVRHKQLEGAVLKARVRELLDAVQIPDAERRAGEYPFQLSGGMKQRVMIAMALACDPELLIADEPTTALDVTIQAQILDLLRVLQRERGMAMLLITHDLAVVAEMAHRVAVMYAGEIVETAERQAFFERPAHPYSRKLFESLPTRAKRGGALAVIRGNVPALTKEFTYCRFNDRCEHAWDLCRSVVPPWYTLGEGRGVRCHLYGDQAAAGATPAASGSPLAAAVSAPPVAPATSGAAALLSVDGLKVHFPVRKGLFQRVVGQVKAVDGVSFTIERGKTLGLVGESGCGKTTIGKGILRLVEPTSGAVRFDGVDLLKLSQGELRPRRKHVQIIFQDPYSSLNPRMRVAETIEEGMSALGIGADTRERQRRIDALLAEVGLPADVKYRYPHEFSGGQRQRIAIARALSVEPDLIVCDEPTSALDVSVQAQILNLLKELQARKGLAFLFISHNISVIEFLAHEVAVMYLGRIVERGAVDEVLGNPRHPYTRALLSAVPTLDPNKREIIRLQGDLPSPVAPPSGCHFHPRCPNVMPQCHETYPGDSVFSATHVARCHLYPPAEKDPGAVVR
jgi:peptide/nickel transport system ATP-binding protein